jgi:DNA invertase Pin-like site-specific DNA recombinase
MTDSTYMREAPGLPSIKTQKEALGLDKIAEDDPVYIDLNQKRKRSTPAEPYPELAEAIRAIREGEKLRVYGPEILGGSDAQILAVMQALGAKGASIYDAAADKVVVWSSEALEALAWAQRGEATHRSTALKKARIRRAELGRTGGPKPKLTGKAKEAALKIWLDPEFTGNQAAEKIGISPSTAYRKLGPRDQPIFGRKAKT